MESNEVEKLVEWVLDKIIQHDPRTAPKIFNRCLEVAEIPAMYETGTLVIEEWRKVVKSILFDHDPPLALIESDQLTVDRAIKAGYIIPLVPFEDHTIDDAEEEYKRDKEA